MASILIKKYFINLGKNSVFFSQHFFQVEGCEPIYLDGVCCPVKYICGKIFFYTIFIWAEMEFKEFEPRFKLSAGLNLETFDTISSGTNHIKAAV